MSDITFSFDNFNFYSPILKGGQKIQLEFATRQPVRVVLETRLAADNAWVVQRNFTAAPAIIIPLNRYAEGQEFRIRTATRPAAAVAAPIDTAATPTDVDYNELSNRIQDLEEGNEPLVLSINPETGNLEQEGISSGSFGIDTEEGTLYFES